MLSNIKNLIVFKHLLVNKIVFDNKVFIFLELDQSVYNNNTVLKLY